MVSNQNKTNKMIGAADGTLSDSHGGWSDSSDEKADKKCQDVFSDLQPPSSANITAT